MSGSAPQAPTPASPHGESSRAPSARSTRVGRRRPSLLWHLFATLFDIAITGVALLLITWAPLRDGLFALQAQQGGHVTSVPLLNRDFVRSVVPVLDGVIIFAFVIRLLTRMAGVRGWTLLLGLVARLLGGLAIVYVVLQPVIFAIAPSVTAHPLSGSSLQAFAEHWARVALLVSLVFVALGVIGQLIAMARHRRQQRASATK